MASARPSGFSPVGQWVEALLWIAAAGSIGVLTRPWFTIADQAMLLLVGVVAAGTRLGRGPALFAATAAVAAFNFLFVPPFFTFAVADLRHVVTFGVLFGVGVLVTSLMQRIREQAEERERLAAEAERVRASAEADKLRSALLSAVSHDLRTPLASISGSATALLAQQLSPGQRRELLSTIREESDRLGRLVTDLLDLTRIESATPVARREETPVEEVLAGAIGRLQPQLEGRHVTVDVPDEVLQAPMDATLIAQVVTNLLENAVKYSASGTPIDVIARPDGEAVRIEVADRGRGLPHGQEGRLFERFFRADDGDRTGGNGLGLAICSAIVKAHHGRIEARDRDGGGAVFAFWLPVS